MSDREEFSLILASSVHDMKNSVGMLLVSLEEFIHEAETQTPEQSARLATLQYEASRISGELIQLLSIYRMQGNRLPVNIEQHFVHDLFDEQVARNDMLFQTRGIQVEIDCDDNLNGYFDGELVAGVIHNVLVNSARYTKDTIRLNARKEGETLVIAVADDGPGFPKAMLEEPLNDGRGVDFTSGSTNLGLFFAAQVAALHEQKGERGKIALSNGDVLCGGTFRLYLP